MPSLNLALSLRMIWPAAKVLHAPVFLRRRPKISDKSYYWRKKIEGLSRSQVSEMKLLKKETEPLKRILADLRLDKVPHFSKIYFDPNCVHLIKSCSRNQQDPTNTGWQHAALSGVVCVCQYGRQSAV